MVKLDIKKINLILERDYNSKVSAERFMKYEKMLNQYFEFLPIEVLNLFVGFHIFLSYTTYHQRIDHLRADLFFPTV